MKSKVMTTEDIHSLISKNYDEYCVFIQPCGIVDMDDTINKFNLQCSVYELSAEEMILEFYESKSVALQRVNQFIEESPRTLVTSVMS